MSEGRAEGEVIMGPEGVGISARIGGLFSRSS